jgi:hypothetical protein
LPKKGHVGGKEESNQGWIGPFQRHISNLRLMMDRKEILWVVDNARISGPFLGLLRAGQ